MSSPPLPPEILDYIIDILRGEPRTLRSCCLVAKSWIPRARKHLFACVKFHSLKDLQSWKRTFPELSNSPAHHTRILSVNCFKVVEATDAAEEGWIPAFPRVECLELKTFLTSFRTLSLSPFRQFSPTIKSLRVDALVLPCSRILNLASSFPLLEDLSFVCYTLSSNSDCYTHASWPVAPLISPPFTGSLKLKPLRGLCIAARRLLDPPNRLRFRDIELSWHDEEDLRWTRELVLACRDTLKFLALTCLPSSTYWFLSVARN